MDGIHDLGGRQGFGAIPRDETVFAADWQRRVFGIALVGGLANVDAFRHAIERVDPVTYLTAGYWGRWLAALERLAAEDDAALRRASPLALRDRASPARFAPGDRVRVRDLHTDGHTRMPAYARGRRGAVVAGRGVWVYPDANAHGRGEDPQDVYTVAFDARELWGETAEPDCRVHLDLFDPYLEPDPEERAP